MIMTIIQPYQSDQIDEGVDDFMVVDLDYTSPQTFNPAYSPYTLIPVDIYNSTMTHTGVIDQYQYFTYTDLWFDIDTWEMQVNRYVTGVSTIALGGFIRFTHNGQSKIGIIERIERNLGPEGKSSEMWLISGRGVESILQSRLATYGAATGTGYQTFTTTSATTIMRTIVTNDCISTAAARIITGLALDASPAADASSLNYSTRYQPLTDIFYDICTQVGASYALVWTGTGLNFTFNVKWGTDRSASVKISPDFDNVNSFDYLLTNAELKNLAYVGGPGTAASRSMSAVYVTSEPTGWARKETFVEASDCLDSGALAARGAATLATMGLQTVLQVEYRESNTFKYGTDFYNGDTVSVIYPGIVSTTGQIVAATERFDAKGILTTLTIGRVYPTLLGIMKNQNKAVTAQVRR